MNGFSIPINKLRRDGRDGNHYHRVWSAFAVALNIGGIALVVFAIYRFYGLRGQLL
jgi:hypothetical protein